VVGLIGEPTLRSSLSSARHVGRDEFVTSSPPAVAAADVLTHLLVFVPCWKLQSAHALLLGKGYGPRMEVAARYGDVLSRATRARAGSPI